MEIFAMNTDQILFKELDKYSEPLRKTANELAALYTEVPGNSPEIREIIESLRKIYSCPIEQIDVAINDVKNAFLILNLKMNENARLIGSPELIPILEKNNLLAKEAQALETKALELNRTCED
jgi:hypothetical protein